MIKKKFVKLTIAIALIVISSIFGFTYAKGICSYYLLCSDINDLKNEASPFSNCVNSPSLLADSVAGLPYVSGELMITQLQTTENGVEAVKSLTIDELRALTEPAESIEVSIPTSNVEELLKSLAKIKLAYEYLDITDNVVTIRVYIEEVKI